MNHEVYQDDEKKLKVITSHGEGVMTKGFIHPFGGSALERECDGNLKCLRSGGTNKV